MINRLILIAIPASVALALVASQVASQGPVVQSDYPSWRWPAPDPARGEQLAQVCSTCHAASSAQVNPPAPKLLHQRQSYLFFALRAYRGGERESDLMAPFASDLSDQDMRDIAAYQAGDMLDRPPPVRTDSPAYPRTINECISCHGETGIGEFEAMPVLTGQDAAYLETALSEYRSGKRGNPTMRAIASGLSDADIVAFAEYYAAHEWLEHRP